MLGPVLACRCGGTCCSSGSNPDSLTLPGAAPVLPQLPATAWPWLGMLQLLEDPSKEAQAGLVGMAQARLFLQCPVLVLAHPALEVKG